MIQALKIFARGGKASLVLGVSALAFALGLFFAGPAMAQQQGQCPAGISVELDGVTGPFAIGEAIPIKLTLEMGWVEGGTTAHISQFQYLLDCASTDDYPNCTPQGNGVTFDHGSVDTTCQSADGDLKANLQTTPSGLVTIDFTVLDSDPAAIALDSAPSFGQFNTCDVTFDVTIDSLSESNAAREVLEITGWGGTDAVCTNETTSSLSSGEIILPVTNPNSVFWVTKDFTDDNESDVDVQFRCDAGIVFHEEASIHDPVAGPFFDRKGFVVYGIPSIGANCTIWEEPVPEGYDVSYQASAEQGADYETLGQLEDDQGCFYTKVMSGEFNCEITNTGKPAEFRVYKEWIVENSGGDAVLEEAVVTIECDSDILPGVPAADEEEGIVEGELIGSNLKRGTLGDGESLIALVDTTDGPVFCEATETVQESGVESVDDCGERKLLAGESSECTFTNTVFFEGIPTLGHYGKALMILLMLGFAVMGIRRLA